ncbi:MAG: VWA domain-containing protein [Candidatus Erginobacter occultus]|nr:VWA domain-containing protein [Candidatus Erginobacter occultus]
MKFSALNLAWLFLLLPALFFFFRVAARRTRKAEADFADHPLWQRLRGGVSDRRRKLEPVILLAVTGLLVSSLLQPRWGYDWQDITRRGIDLVAVVDTSRSMLAADVAPDRLARARRILEDLTRRVRGDRLGLVAFSGSAFTLCPLTLDRGAFRMFINDLSPETIPRGGTDIAAGIRKAIETFDPEADSHRAILVISDGENLEGDYRSAARAAAELGIPIFAIGVGTTEGTPIVLETSAGTTYLKDREGNIVVSRLDETALQEIALLSGGAYHRAAPDGREVDLIYTDRIARMEGKELEETRRKIYRHRYQFPLALALLLLAVQSLLGDRRVNKGRRKETVSAGGGDR